jgi:hypothetical protein
MKRIDLRIVAGCALLVSALLAMELPAQSTGDVSAAEARQVTGGQSGGPCFVGSYGGYGCTCGSSGIKFWESCTSSQWFSVNTGYSGPDMITTVYCYTTCGYSCGAYNAPVNCSSYGS